MQECKYASILSPNIFDPNLTWPELFQTEHTQRLAHLLSFCELVFANFLFLSPPCKVWHTSPSLGPKYRFWANNPSSFNGTSVSLIFTKKVLSLSGSSFNIQKRVRDYLLLTKIVRRRSSLPLQSKQEKNLKGSKVETAHYNNNNKSMVLFAT